MGRLPSHGVAWYRKQFTLAKDDKNKRIYLHIDGAMSYSMVWLNGHLVGVGLMVIALINLILRPMSLLDKPINLLFDLITRRNLLAGIPVAVSIEMYG